MRKQFKEGDKVLRYQARFKFKKGKFKTSWDGPYTVVKVHNFGMVELKEEASDKIFQCNGHLLKLYSEPAEPTWGQVVPFFSLLLFACLLSSIYYIAYDCIEFWKGCTSSVGICFHFCCFAVLFLLINSLVFCLTHLWYCHTLNCIISLTHLGTLCLACDYGLQWGHCIELCGGGR